MSTPLPKFSNPPVIEMALGVEFESLSNWQIPHFGLYWNQIRSSYPVSSVVAPLPSQVEQFGADRQVETFKFSLSPKPEVRCWFTNDQQSWLLQVQDSRFIQNWRKTATEYPHYPEARRRFNKEWDQLVNFLEKQKIGTPSIKQCEVTYVNHLEIDDNPNFLSEVFPFLSEQTERSFLPLPEATVINLIYPIPVEKGRLYVSIQPIIRHTDAKELLQLTLVARGCPESSELTHISNWFDLGHEWVVRGFTELTSEKMHNLWQRKQ